MHKRMITLLGMVVAFSMVVLPAGLAQAGHNKSYRKVTGIKEIDRILFRRSDRDHDTRHVTHHDTHRDTHRDTHQSNRYYRQASRHDSHNKNHKRHSTKSRRRTHQHGLHCGHHAVQERIWVKEHYETRIIELVIPATEERVWIPAVYERRLDPCSRRYRRVRVVTGHYETRYIPERIEHREEEVVIPGYYKYVTVYH